VASRRATPPVDDDAPARALDADVASGTATAFLDEAADAVLTRLVRPPLLTTPAPEATPDVRREVKPVDEAAEREDPPVLDEAVDAAEDSVDELSAHATPCPANTAVPTPSATANPPTRPMNPAALIVRPRSRWDLAGDETIRGSC
jgi:hypothetical protein